MKVKYLKQIISLGALFFLFAMPIGSYAQEDNAVPQLTLNVEKDVQKPKNMVLPLNISIDSTIDIEKLEIKVLRRDSGVAVETPEVQMKSIKKGETLNLEAQIKPLSSGTHTVQVKVQGYLPGENAVATKTLDLQFADDLQIQPQSEAYKIAETRAHVVDIIILIVGFTIVGLVLFFIKVKFRTWLDSDDT